MACIDGYCDVVIIMENVLKRLFNVVGTIENWEIKQGSGEEFQEERHKCERFPCALFQQLSHFEQFCEINLLVEHQMRYLITFRHRFLHSTLIVLHRHSSF